MSKQKIKSFWMIISLAILTIFTTVGCSLEELRPLLEEEQLQVESPSENNINDETKSIDEFASYTSKEEVSAYLQTYGKLPQNFIQKNQAKDLGWDPSKGNLFEVTEEKSIGGDRFYNREGRLPDQKDRKWYEADIDYNGGRRGAKRIVYSNDGLIYYTDDHYDSFEKLYGKE